MEATKSASPTAGGKVAEHRSTTAAPCTCVLLRKEVIQLHVLVRLPVDFAAMADLEHDHFAAFVVYEVDDSIIALPDSVLVLARQFLTPGRSRISSQALNAPDDTPAIFLVDRLQLFDCSRLDEELIGVHAVSSL